MLTSTKPSAGLEGRIETTSLRIFLIFLQLVGLDTADEHRLLDQRGILEPNCQVASLFSCAVVYLSKASTSIFIS